VARPAQPISAQATYGSGLRKLTIAAAALMLLALTMVFFWVPNDADQGFLQKIFYIHVPLAIISLCGFVAGGVLAIFHLRTGDRRWDMRSYVAIHLSLVFAVGTLITGSIWARGSWGHWWVWSEPTLVSFLIVFLLYATYQPLRFAIEDPERQARYASVFAITCGAFVPLNFLAVRLSTQYLHPRVLGETSNLPWKFALTFYVSLLAMTVLFVALWKFEMTAKQTRAQVRTLRRLLTEDRSDFVPASGRSAAPRPDAPLTPAPTTPGSAGRVHPPAPAPALTRTSPR